MAAFTIDQYNAIVAAIGSGELVVQYNGKRVEYRSIDELLRAKNAIETDLVASGQLSLPTAGGITRGSTTYAAFERE